MQWLYLKYSKQSNKTFVDSHHPLLPGSSTFRHVFLWQLAGWFGRSSFGICFGRLGILDLQFGKKMAVLAACDVHRHTGTNWKHMADPQAEHARRKYCSCDLVHLYRWCSFRSILLFVLSSGGSVFCFRICYLCFTEVWVQKCHWREILNPTRCCTRGVFFFWNKLYEGSSGAGTPWSASVLGAPSINTPKCAWII